MAKSVQPQVNSFWYLESLAIFWLNLHPILGFHITETSSLYARWGKNIEPLPRRVFRKFIQLDVSSDISSREFWGQYFRYKRDVDGLEEDSSLVAECFILSHIWRVVFLLASITNCFNESQIVSFLFPDYKKKKNNA